MVGYSLNAAHNSVMHMPVSRTRAATGRFKEVETVRLFTASGHPWMGFAALVVLRAPPILLAGVLLVKHWL